MASFNYPPLSNGVPVYSTLSAFPSGSAAGDLAVAADTGNLYEWTGSAWQLIGGPGAALSLGNLDSQTASAAKGAGLTGGILAMQSASATVPGLVNITTQTLAGNKTFSGTISASNLSGTNTGDVTLAAVGAVPNANAASLTGQALTLQPADGSNPGVLTSGAQSIGGAKTFTGAISASNLSGSNTGNLTLAAVGAAPDANGATLSGQVLTLQPADATHPGLLTIGTQSIAGDKTFSGVTAIGGTTTNNAAAAGFVGERVNSTVASGSAVSLTVSNTIYDVTSISLTAGDWDVSGIVVFDGGAVTATELRMGISTTTASLSGLGNASVCTPYPQVAGAAQTLTLPTLRVSLAAPSSVFLCARQIFTVGTPTAYGRISARRAR